MLFSENDRFPGYLSEYWLNNDMMIIGIFADCQRYPKKQSCSFL